MKERLSFFFIILSIFFQAMAAVSLKYASSAFKGFSPAIIFNAFFVLSLLCLFIQAIVWQQALKRYQLSFAYPFMSLVNFVILFLSYVFFSEGITPMNIVGLAVISAGVYVLSTEGALQ